MRRTMQAFVAAGVVAGFLAFAGPALAAQRTVCHAGCQYTSIQAAVNAAKPGDTIQIGPGNYYENVDVNKPLTLTGWGLLTTIYPAVANPTCSGGSLCGGTASNIILVDADNVTIANLRLEGANPYLSRSVGAEVGGVYVDATNGIITDYDDASGIQNNLTVTGVNVSDIYLRGIYAASGGTFNFNHDAVENVQGDSSSIAMFDFGGSGVMADNLVINANDAISANWSTGTQFLGNTVLDSGSGVHTDNNGGAGGVADLIKDNYVQGCTVNGYGIYTFAPYVSATVESNTVVGCYVGLADFGSSVSGQGPTFANNTVSGFGAKTTDPNGTYGAYLTTDLLGYAFGDLTATLTGNLFTLSGTGMFVTQTTPTPGQPAGGQATVTASGNSFVADKTGANGGVGTVVNAANNWWGCRTGPNTPGCTTAIGTVTYTPWLTRP
jgi:hypothetical protein